MEEQETLYEILGVKPNADIEEIRERYRILTREIHPDLNPTHHDIGLFIKVRRAYEVLKDRKRREEYDKTLGIYHSKEIGTAFLRATSHQLMREKIDGSDDEYDIKEFVPSIQSQLERNVEKETGIVDKIKSIFGLKKEKEEEEIELPRILKKVKVKKEEEQTPIRQRNYQFSITPLESILGTERIIVLGEIGEKQNSIKVKIPKGIGDNTTIKIFHPERGTIPILIKYYEHPWIKRNNDDVILTLPFTENERLSDQTLEVFTCQGKVEVVVPKNSNQMIKLEEHGILNKKNETLGNFYVEPKTGDDRSPIERINITKLLEPLHLEEN